MSKKFNWTGKRRGQQHLAGWGWDAYRTRAANGCVAVIFVHSDDRAIFGANLPSPKASTAWVKMRVKIVQETRARQFKQEQENRLKVLRDGRGNIPVKFIMAFCADATPMDSVVERIRLTAQTLAPIDLGVVRHVALDENGQPLYIVGQKGKTYLWQLSGFTPCAELRWAVRTFHIEQYR